MREIKFRAWDTTSKEMYDLNAVEDYPFSYIAKGDTPYTKFMQYTGMKDRNGVEIYEGDIVKSYSKTGGWEIDSVEFKNSRFVLHDKDGILSDIWLGDEELEKLEVIGNIYENPDLLTD